MKKIHTVLVVDDDGEDINIFIDAISEVDNTISCITAKDGFDALKLLKKKNHDLPDIIFLDLNMPRMDGKQFLAERNKISELLSIPVIIYSTTKRAIDIDETKGLGAADFMTKPIRYKDICKAISNVLQKIREAATYE